jgi:DNA topoisomerase-1
MNLMIVESPAKSRTISKFLGSDWKVVASYGHVRDLPKKVLGVDPDHNFEPKYQINFKSRKIIKEIRELAHKAKEIYLATDYDREGEAIAWHLMVAIGNGNFKSTEGIKRELVIPRVNRITFHEITNSAINQALKKPRGIDLNLVDAQQARRILDRLVGYKLSPFLWHKVASGLSAGRVGSRKGKGNRAICPRRILVSRCPFPKAIIQNKSISS